MGMQQTACQWNKTLRNKDGIQNRIIKYAVIIRDSFLSLVLHTAVTLWPQWFAAPAGICDYIFHK